MSPEVLSGFIILTKLGGVPVNTNETACGQLGVLATKKADKDGCESIPTLIAIRLGGD